eukprot:gb/GECH01005800.1/.p1 GENE.gb/GECH01005800.1/~~gb/GECH01005800.1/.p1  ORF type:complete len:496 (+),score=69.13 gb/GECH01005800.1/:1-1488(+)
MDRKVQQLGESLKKLAKNKRTYPLDLQCYYAKRIVENNERKKTIMKRDNIPESCLRRWAKNYKEGKYNNIQTLKKRRMRKRLSGAGRKPRFDEDEEQKMKKWVIDKRTQDLDVSREDILALARNKEPSAKISMRWVECFMKRNKLSLRRGSPSGRVIPEDAVIRIEAWKKYLQTEETDLKAAVQVWNMDDTGIFKDLTATTTVEIRGEKTVSLRTTGSTKDRITFAPVIANNGKFINSLVVKKGAASKKKSGLERYRIQRSGLLRDGIFAYKQPNAFVNIPIMLLFIQDAIPSVTGINYFFMDQFSAHTDPTVIKALNDKGWRVRFIPAGMTGYAQPIDVGINRDLKRGIKEKWREYMRKKLFDENVLKPSAPSWESVANWAQDVMNEEVSEKKVRNAFEGSGMKITFPQHLLHNESQQEKECRLDRELKSFYKNFIPDDDFQKKLDEQVDIIMGKKFEMVQGDVIQSEEEEELQPEVEFSTSGILSAGVASQQN